MKDLKKIVFVCMTLNIVMFYLLFTWNYSISIINPFVMYAITSFVVIMSYIVCAVVVIVSIMNDEDTEDTEDTEE